MTLMKMLCKQELHSRNYIQRGVIVEFDYEPLWVISSQIKASEIVQDWR